MSAQPSPVQIPDRLACTLDGSHLGEGSTHTALVLCTRADSGAVHVALLSRAEAVVVSPTRMLLALHAETTTARNLGQTGDATLMSQDEGGTLTVSLSARDPRPLSIAGQALAAFDAQVTTRRWAQTVAALRAEYGL
jgi:hypothetical protein